MNKTALVVFGLLILGIYSTNAVAFHNCDDQRFAIYYLNGIATIDEIAEENSYALAAAIKEEATTYQIDTDCLYVDYSHVESGGGFSFAVPDGANDLLESFIQWKYQTGLVVDFYEWLSMGAPTYVGFPVISLARDIVTSATEEGLRDEIIATTQEFAAVYKQMIQDHDATVIIVSHSQGNFFANAVYRKVVNEDGFPANKIHIVGVATPANKVEPDGVRDLYTTNQGDIIRVVPGNLRARDETENCNNFADSLIHLNNFVCHSFIGSYLEEPETLQSILDDIFSIIAPQAPVMRRITKFAHPSSQIFAVAEESGDIYLSAKPFPSSHTDLLRVEGPDNPPAIAADTNSGSDDDVQLLKTVGSDLYFMARDDAFAYQLWRGNTLLGFNLSEIPISRIPLNLPIDVQTFTVTGDALSVMAREGEHFQPYIVEFLDSPGAKAMNRIVGKDGTELYRAVEFQRVGDRIFFQASETPIFAGSNEIWSTAATTIFPEVLKVPDDPEGRVFNPSIYTGRSTVFDDKYYFTLSVSGNFEQDHDLYYTDGIVTEKAIDIIYGRYGISSLLTTDDLIYIRYGQTGLMSTDGTPGGTTDFGEFGVASMQIVTTSEAAYFTVGVGNTSPSTLYKAEAGAISEVRSSDSLISSLTVHNDELYFVDGNAVYSLVRGAGITEYLLDSQVIDIYQLFTLPSGVYGEVDYANFGRELAAFQ